MHTKKQADSRRLNILQGHSSGISHATQLQNTDEAVKHMNILTAVDMLALVYDRPKQT
jgi:hypothetical protein